MRSPLNQWLTINFDVKKYILSKQKTLHILQLKVFIHTGRTLLFTTLQAKKLEIIKNLKNLCIL